MDVSSEKVIAILKENFSKNDEIFLVGGAIRDAIQEKETRDLDFVMRKNSILAARTTADHFHGNFYIFCHYRMGMARFFWFLIS